MKKNYINKKSSRKNISSERRLFIAYNKFITIVKIIIIVFFALLFFTDHLNSITNNLKKNIYEFTGDLGLKLENVLIEGQKYTSENDILSALATEAGIPILSINLQKIKTKLEKISWVKNAIVRRSLPDSIYLGIIERIPIAIWQSNMKLAIIDKDGFKITDNINKIEQFSGLLHVVGSDANIYADSLIKELEKYPELYTKVTSAVRHGERRWNLNLIENITIKMPEKDLAEALEYIAKLYESDKLFNQNLKMLDLRDPTKYYIAQ